MRFIAAADEEAREAADRRQLSVADYLGLTGFARQFFSDPVLLGALAFVLLVVALGFFFGFAFGWIDPLFIDWVEAPWTPSAVPLEPASQ